MSVPAGAPPTLHVKAHVDSATVYKNKSRLRRCAPLSFTAAMEEVQVMVPMPSSDDGASFDRDSVQVEFGNAFDGKVILAGVVLDEVDERCLRADGTVDLNAAPQQSTEEAESVTSDNEDEEGGGAKTPAEERREVQRQLADVQLRLRLNQIALEEATAARDFTVDMAKRVVGKSSDAVLAGAGALLDENMWAAQLDVVAAAKRDFFRRRRELQRERKGLEDEKTVLESKATASGPGSRGGVAGKSTMVSVAVLTLKVLTAVPAGSDAVVFVSYMVPRGSWTAVYEAHLDTTTNEVVLYYNAEVRMNGGEDLRDVQLTLSSAAPRRNASLPPSMAIWRCGVVQAQPAPRFGAAQADFVAPMAMMRCAAPAPMMRRMDAVVETVGAGGVVNFSIPTPQTVLSSGKLSRVPLTELRMAAKISYVCVPGKMLAVFTHAKVRNTSDFLLLCGDVAVFLDGSYVTRSRVATECAAGGVLELDFGVDRSVDVKRVLLRQSTHEVQRSFLQGTKNKVKTFTYKVTLRNKKRAAGETNGLVCVKLIEHIPISDQEQLQVRLVSPANPQQEVYIFDDEDDKKEQLERKARLLANDGVVEIERKVAAGQSVEVLFSFEVEAPSTATVWGL